MRHCWFRRLSIFTVLAMLSVSLAACGGDTNTPGTGSTTEATATTAGTTGGTEATATTGEAAGGTDATPTTAAEGGGALETATTGTSGGTGGTGGTLPEGCSNVELSYWNPFTGPDGPFMGTLTDKFNADNPNIKVTMTTQADYYTQIQTAAASDTLPDVAIIHADQVATWAFRNVLRPIDDIATSMNLTANDFPAGVWKAGQVAGKRYSIPLDM